MGLSGQAGKLLKLGMKLDGNVVDFLDMIVKVDGVRVLPQFLLGNGDIFYVSSVSGDNAAQGDTPAVAFATIDFAVSKCANNHKDVIVVLPGHLEDLADATIDFDKAGITVIGIGQGLDRPLITYDHVDASVDIGANSVHLINLGFRPSLPDVKVGVDIETGKTNCVIENCVFMEGEAGDITDEFILSLNIKAGCHDTVVKDCEFYTFATCSACTHAIKLTGASDRVKILGCYCSGNYSTAAIGSDTTLSTEILISGNILKVKDGEPGIEMYTGTTGVISNNQIESTGATIDTLIVADQMSWIENYGAVADGAAGGLIGAGGGAEFADVNLDHLAKTACADTTDAIDMVEIVDDTILANMLTNDGESDGFDRRYHSLEAIADKLGANDTNNVFDSSTVVANEDGSVIERLEQIQEAVNKGVGTPIGAAKSLVDALGSNGLAVADSAVSVLGAVGANNANNAFDSSAIVANADGSALERLEYLADSVADAQADINTAVDEPPTAKSLQDILHKDGSYTFDNTTDSLEAIADTQATAVAHATQVALAPAVVTKTLTDWAAATNAAFTVSGPVKCTLWGVCLVAVKATTMNLSLVGTATSPGAAPIDIASLVDCNADAAGTCYSLGAAFGDTLVPTTEGVADPSFSFVMGAGSIGMASAAVEDGGGSIAWYLRYEPLATGATVVAA